MKFTKKFILLTLMLILIGAISFPVYASTDSTYATLTIYAFDGNDSSSSSSSFNFSGHAFIVVENNSSSSITVGKMSIPANGTVSLGTWGNKEGHTGLWYNLEGYFYNELDAYNGRVSLTMNLTSSELSTLNSQINSTDSWTLFRNCSTFAKNAWNSVSSTSLSAGFIHTPSNLKASIKKHSYQSNRSFGYNTNVGYYNGNTFVSVNMNTLNTIIANNNTLSFEDDFTIHNQFNNPESFPDNLFNFQKENFNSRTN